MADRPLCSRVIGTPDCATCRRNPENGHPHGDWDDDWRQPRLEAGWPRAICASVEPMPDVSTTA